MISFIPSGPFAVENLSIFHLVIFLGILLATTRYLLIPIIKKRLILNQKESCPSLLLPPLPEAYDKVQRVPNQKSGGREYRLNLRRLTCTCSHFKRRRGFYPTNDIRRLCRHLRKALVQSNAVAHFDELNQCIIEHKVKDRCYAQVILAGSNLAFGFHHKNDFARVYCHRKEPYDPPEGPFTGAYDKFTLLVSQEVWVYGEPPPNPIEIIQTLKQLTASARHHPATPTS